MKEQIKKALGKTRKAVTGVAEHGRTKGTIDWSRKAGSELKDQAVGLGKDAIRSNIGKAAAKWAAIGAVVAVPIPLVGPVFGAVIGAGIGVYLNLRNGPTSASGRQTHSRNTRNEASIEQDAIASLERLQQLRQSGAITDSEFETQKQKLLKRI